MKIGNTRVDFEALLIEGPAGRHSMEPKVMTLLRVLVENAGQVMTREELINQVWGVEFGGDERLSRAVSILRKALGDERGRHTHIQTISRRGYCLIAEVTEDDGVVLPKVLHAASKRDLVLPPESPVKQIDDTSDLSESQPAGMPLPLKSKRPLGRWLALGSLTLAATLMISAGVMTLRPNGYFSVQASMAEGLAHIENFTAKDAIEDAQDIFGIILADNPDHAAARAGLALALMREYTHLEHDPALLQRATATAHAALRQDEHLALANIAAACSELLQEKFEKSHNLLDRADILEPNNKLNIECRAATFKAQGKYEEAFEVLENAVNLYPDYSWFHLELAELFLHSGKLEDAEIIFKRGIALSKDNPRAYAELAHVLHLQDKTTEAIQIIQEGLKINEVALLYNNLGTYLFFQGQYDMAAEAFKKTIELEGDSHSYLYWANLGDAYRWTDSHIKEASLAYMRALQLLQIKLDKRPNDQNLHSRAALYNAKLGDFESAQLALEHVFVNDKLLPIQYYRTVVSYEIMANRSKALAMLSRAIDSGYPLTEIKNDPELTNLRQDPAYHLLLTQLSAQQKGKDL